MPLYEIEQYEIHSQTYRVEADSEADAINLLFEGQAAPVNGSCVFIEVADDLGLPADDYQDMARALSELGVNTKAVIPSIREITEIRRSNNARRR